MTALALKRIVHESLAEVGISFEYPYPYRSDTKARSTTWFEHERGFGLRLYPTGREVYIVQTRMAGRLRTITIAPSTIISQHQALTIARRVIAYAQVGHDPATDRARIRSAGGTPPRLGDGRLSELSLLTDTENKARSAIDDSRSRQRNPLLQQTDPKP